MFDNYAAAPEGGKHLTVVAALLLIGPFILRGLLSGSMPSKRQLAEKLGHKSSNWLGTALGRGQNGDGARLWKTSTGEIRRVRENLRIADRCNLDDVQTILAEFKVIDESDDLNDPAVQAKVQEAVAKLLPSVS